MMASEAVRLYRSMVRGVAQLPFRHSVREKMQFNLREVFEVRRGVVDADKIAALIVEGALSSAGALSIYTYLYLSLSISPPQCPMADACSLFCKKAGREVREALRTLNAVDVETIDLIVRVEDRSAAERP